MAAAGEEREEGGRLGGVGGLAEQPPAEGDDGVGGQHHLVVSRGDGLGLGHGQAQGAGAGGLAAARGLVDLGGEDGVGDDADLREQLAPARAGGREDQPRAQGARAHLKR